MINSPENQPEKPKGNAGDLPKDGELPQGRELPRGELMTYRQIFQGSTVGDGPYTGVGFCMRLSPDLTVQQHIEALLGPAASDHYLRDWSDHLSPWLDGSKFDRVFGSRVETVQAILLLDQDGVPLGVNDALRYTTKSDPELARVAGLRVATSADIALVCAAVVASASKLSLHLDGFNPAYKELHQGNDNRVTPDEAKLLETLATTFIYGPSGAQVFIKEQLSVFNFHDHTVYAVNKGKGALLLRP